MTLMLLGYQDAPLPAIPKEGGWIASAVFLAIIVWREFTKSRAEREATQVVGYKDLADRATKSAVDALATVAKKDDENGKLRDQLTAKTVECGGVAAENRYLREELEQTRKELEAARTLHRPAEG